MSRISDAPALDRPWHRPGAFSYALSRLWGFRRAPVTVHQPVPGTVLLDHDIDVTTRDGTILRVNVYRSPSEERGPVLLFAHPYGKDNLPTRGRLGRLRLPRPYRLLRQTGRIAFSSLTGWEAPDPAWWVARGYIVVNCDLRGAGTSQGVGGLMSDQEGEDVYDLIEWAAVQPWSNGSVGLMGVSYLAISQWKAAALRPPSLKAMVPWEGFTDAYRDLLRPGGIREDGFVKMWSRSLKGNQLKYQLPAEQHRRPLRDDWWQSLAPDLPKIEVPALICASFSDNNLHGRGSMRAFEQISSPDRFLYTHRSGKWATFYADEPRQVQAAFLDRYLRGRDVPAPPRIRLEVREDRQRVVEVRQEANWPLDRTEWTELYLTNSGLTRDPATEPGSITFDTRRRGVRFGWTLVEDTELTGPMAVRLFVGVEGAEDVDLIVGVEKWNGSRYVPFEGSYGFGRDRVTTGWQKASMRALSPALSRPFDPVPSYATQEPLRSGEIVPVDIALGSSATMFRAGERLQLVVAGRWLWPRNPLTGQFPAAYQPAPRVHCTLHWGPTEHARLLVPVIGAAAEVS